MTFLLLQILDSLRAGANLIYSNYPLLTMKKGFAFNPSFVSSHDDSSSTTAGVKRTAATDTGSNKELSVNDRHAEKRQKLDVTGTFTPNTLLGKVADPEEEEAAGNNDDKKAQPASALKPDWACLNLWDEEYMRDRRPLMEGCGCLACGKHTRAYVHHLLKSKELLAEILLHQHNQYQLQRVFDAVRSSPNIEWIASKVEAFKQHQISK